MAKTVIVTPNQSMLDVIIQGCGSLEAGMRFCRDNDVSITAVPLVGTVYVVSDAALALGSAGVLQYWQQNKVQVGNLAEAGGEVLENTDGTPLLNTDGTPLLNVD